MSIGNRRVNVWILSSLWLLPWTPVLMAREYIRDDANVFGAAAKQRAQESIEQIVKRFNVEVIVETFPSLPPEWEQRRNSASDDNSKELVVTRWARDRAEAARTEGVFILLCREPLRLRIIVGPGAEEHGFSRYDGDRLQKQLRKAFEKNRYDAGLQDGIHRIVGELEKSESGQRGLWYLGVIGVGVACWLGLMVLRSRMRGARQAAALADAGDRVPSTIARASLDRKETRLQNEPSTPYRAHWTYDEHPVSH